MRHSRLACNAGTHGSPAIHRTGGRPPSPPLPPLPAGRLKRDHEVDPSPFSIADHDTIIPILDQLAPYSCCALTGQPARGPANPPGALLDVGIDLLVLT